MEVNMSKLKLVIPVIVVLAIVGIGAYAYFSGGKVTLNGNCVSVSKTTSSESLTGSLNAIMAKGKTVKCSYSIAGNNYEGYIKGNMYRGKADMKEQGVA